ncbi:YgaP-like transmembrane domain [Rhizobium gallicum]|uniref:YgaP-like transmembrane domain n=1 Tax=Rhizobium gallicum TaxID=56730 RepID=UPI0030B89B8B
MSWRKPRRNGQRAISSALEADGLPVVGASQGAPCLTIFRQVQITVGTLVLLSVLCEFLLHPAAFAFAGLLGAALAFSGISGWCGLAILLSCMHWNRIGCTAVKCLCCRCSARSARR